MNNEIEAGAGVDEDWDEELLFENSSCCDGGDAITYDEEGSFALNPPIERAPGPVRRPCSLATLNGSWLLALTTTGPHIRQQIRGPLRIEAQPPRLRLSGDIYVAPTLGPIGPTRAAGPLASVSPAAEGPFVPGALVIQKNWYPAFPQKEYRWYFRSTGATYSNGKLVFKFERHLWSNTSQSFVSQDNGWMEFHCHTSPTRPIGAPRPTIEMKGTAMVGGAPYTVTATKTSPYYRGCLVEVDVMTHRQWPASATSCDGGQTFTYTGVYRAAGMDFRAVVNDLTVPDDPLLTITELHTLLATHRSLSAGGSNWHLWLLVGSRMDGTLGIMFDTGNPPHREGAVGFYDPAFGNADIIHAPARGKKLGEVPLAFLRTLIHEAGHAFNLFHPKHDVHGIPVGTTIMNQTGDVMGFATATHPYPCNATMAFNEHNRTSLIHSPDPQVKPGWKEFGWGHGSAWGGIAEPVDAAGLEQDGIEAEDIALRLDVPGEAVRGEFVSATVTVTNTGRAAHDVTTALNLAEGDLRIEVTTPGGHVIDARDVVVVCGARRMQTLQPGDQLADTVQLFYGPHVRSAGTLRDSRGAVDRRWQYRAQRAGRAVHPAGSNRRRAGHRAADHGHGRGSQPRARRLRDR